MDIEILKKRVGTLEELQLSIESEIATAGEKIQRTVNEHNERINLLIAEKNKLIGKIDVLQEFIDLEKPTIKKEKKEK